MLSQSYPKVVSTLSPIHIMEVFKLSSSYPRFIAGLFQCCLKLFPKLSQCFPTFNLRLSLCCIQVVPNSSQGSVNFASLPCPKIVPKLLKRYLKTAPMLSQSDPKVCLKFSQICLNIVAKLFQDPSDAQMLSV